MQVKIFDSCGWEMPTVAASGLRGYIGTSVYLDRTHRFAAAPYEESPAPPPPSTRYRPDGVDREMANMRRR